MRDQVGATPSARQDLVRAERVLQERRTTSQAFFSSTRRPVGSRARRAVWRARPTSCRSPRCSIRARSSATSAAASGQTRAALAPFVARVIAVDESSAMLAAARERVGHHANVELRGGTPRGRSRSTTASLDVAVLSLVLHFVVDPAAVHPRGGARRCGPAAACSIVDMEPHEREEYRATMGHLWLGFSVEQIDGVARRRPASRHHASSPSPPTRRRRAQPCSPRAPIRSRSAIASHAAHPLSHDSPLRIMATTTTTVPRTSRARSPRVQGGRPLPGRVRPQGDPTRRAGDARPHGAARRVQGEEAARGREDHGLAAHDRADGRAHRDARRARRRRALGELQHLLTQDHAAAAVAVGRDGTVENPKGVARVRVEG